jgi:hypothetical protein
MQIVQPAHEALEVADAVAVRIHIGADGQAIDDRVLVPKIVDHAALRVSAKLINKPEAGRFPGAD